MNDGQAEYGDTGYGRIESAVLLAVLLLVTYVPIIPMSLVHLFYG